jgi:hypothetical protein
MLALSLKEVTFLLFKAPLYIDLPSMVRKYPVILPFGFVGSVQDTSMNVGPIFTAVGADTFSGAGTENLVKGTVEFLY